jgi:probable F420-dependent oxidoreductase
MRIGLHALGIGAGARRSVVDAVARAAEDAGFSTLWAGEHVVMVDRPGSRYPYAADGRIPVPTVSDWLDPLVCLSFAAAATRTITVGTGILLLPEHNPLLVAKQAATLDVLCHGRLVLGVGIGWSAEEFAALGVPFSGRAARTVEYVEAMRTLWREDVATFAGRFTGFEAVRMYPKPDRGRRIPIIFGGNSEAALSRVAAHGDGWYGFGVPGLSGLRECMATLRAHCSRAGRDMTQLYLAAAVQSCEPHHRSELAELGVDELVVVAEPPPDPDAATDWVAGLADRWLRGQIH